LTSSLLEVLCSPHGNQAQGAGPHHAWWAGHGGLAQFHHPTDRIIELGCGPGLAIAALATRAIRGPVVGVDHSQVMIGQARRRNRAAIRAGRVRLIHTPVQRLSNPLSGATAATSAAAANELAGLLTEAGFQHLRTELLELDPPAACVLAQVPPADDAELLAPTAPS
jgi:SAM-dependent methyltransferase